jgi:uncharacterized damage-inducible protein DinB
MAHSMHKEILMALVEQNEVTNSYSLDRVTRENQSLRLNNKTASIGFIYRHIGETMSMFGMFFGVYSEVQNTTIGQTDMGKEYDLETSRSLLEKGYEMLKKLIEDTPDTGWLDQIETPFFGTVSKARLFSHILFHNSHHCGQISLTLKRGK